MSSEFAIQATGVSKCYHIYPSPRARLKQMIAPPLRRMLGRAEKNYFQEFWALRNVSLDVKPGETVGIVGKNGSGKSTLLRLICGITAPTGGEVYTRGRVAALLELGSGFNPDFTGLENVFMNAAVLGLSRQEIKDRLEEIIAFAEIDDFMDRPLRTYSSGMRLRLAFAVQACIEPEVLIVDEALAVGDEKFRRKCFARLERLKKKGTAILFVSHAASQIIELCDRAALMHYGEKLAEGQPDRIMRAYQHLLHAPAGQIAKIAASIRRKDSVIFEENRLDTSADKQVADAQGHCAVRYEPNMLPSSTEYYAEQGAKILSIKLYDAAGELVNVIAPGEHCRIVMETEFQTPQQSVRFATQIRNVSGSVLFVQRFPKDLTFWNSVKAGDKITLTFHFRTSLLPGVYFISGGVFSAGEPPILHRARDIGMFKVDGFAPYSGGLCDLMTRMPEIAERNANSGE